jgi:hypothetical protein
MVVAVKFKGEPAHTGLFDEAVGLKIGLMVTATVPAALVHVPNVAFTE